MGVIIAQNAQIGQSAQVARPDALERHPLIENQLAAGGSNPADRSAGHQRRQAAKGAVVATALLDVSQAVTIRSARSMSGLLELDA